MSGAGHAAGVETAAPVTEPQCPAQSTCVESMSVPVHRNAPNVISATDGYSPADASLPPTIADAGAVPSTHSAHDNAMIRRPLPTTTLNHTQA